MATNLRSHTALMRNDKPSDGDNPVYINWLLRHESNSEDDMFVFSAQPDTILQHVRADIAQEVQRETRSRLKVSGQSISFYFPKPSILMKDVPRDWTKKHQDIKKIAEMYPTASRVDAIPCIDDHRFLHLIIQLKKDPEQENTSVGAEQDEEELGNTFAALSLTSAYKRFNTLNTKDILAPSEAAKSKHRLTAQQKSDTAVYDGFFNRSVEICTRAPPIQIFHGVFHNFVEAISDPSIVPDIDIVKAISKFMNKAAALAKNEEIKTEDLRAMLRDVLEGPVTQMAASDKRCADAVHAVAVDTSSVPLVVVENKRSIGEGSCDPLAQAEYSCISLWTMREDLKCILERTCAPTFIIAGGGPYLAILGFVFTDRWIVQHLTDIMWLGVASTYEDTHKYRIATVFTALRRQVHSLRNFYESCKSIPPMKSPRPHPRFFPYWSSCVRFHDKKQVKFQYIRPLENDTLCVGWLAQVVVDNADMPRGPDLADEGGRPDSKAQPQLLAVKFVDRYGTKAHDLLAEHGFAPKLHYIGSLDGTKDIRECNTHNYDEEVKQGLYVGPLRMVVMDFVSGKHASKLNSDKLAQMQEVLNTLRVEGLVHGDLRPPNVLFSSDLEKPQIIDFDWAGRAGQTMYPPDISDGRPAGIKEFGYIIADHDEAMLQELFG